MQLLHNPGWRRDDEDGGPGSNLSNVAQALHYPILPEAIAVPNRVKARAVRSCLQNGYRHTPRTCQTGAYTVAMESRARRTWIFPLKLCERPALQHPLCGESLQAMRGARVRRFADAGGRCWLKPFDVLSRGATSIPAPLPSSPFPTTYSANAAGATPRRLCVAVRDSDTLPRTTP